MCLSMDRADKECNHTYVSNFFRDKREKGLEKCDSH